MKYVAETRHLPTVTVSVSGAELRNPGLSVGNALCVLGTSEDGDQVEPRDLDWKLSSIEHVSPDPEENVTPIYKRNLSLARAIPRSGHRLAR